MTKQFQQLSVLHLELARMANAAAERGDTQRAEVLDRQAKKVQTQLMTICTAMKWQWPACLPSSS
jgi:hypothetical protein